LPTEIEKNQYLILRYLYQTDKKLGGNISFNPDDIRKGTNLTPIQLNDAVELLDESGLIGSLPGSANPPYKFQAVWLTAKGKYEFEKKGLPKQKEAHTQDPRKVFVVHGRNLKARDALFAFLRSIDLHPLEWSELVAATGKGSPYIGEILDKAFYQAQAVVVLMTPDDEGHLKEHFIKPEDPPYETELTGQARLNVLFEAGMAMGRCSVRTILVELGVLRPFSDVGGRYIIKLNDTTQKRQELAQRLKTAGCLVNLSGTDWHKAGSFEASLDDASKEKKYTKLSVEIGTPPVNLDSFDESLKTLEEVSQPKTKATLLAEFQPKLHNLCYNFDWSDKIRDRIVKVLECIPVQLSNDPNIDWYLQYLGMIINRHGKHTISMIKEKFLGELDHLYNDPKYETNSKILSILQELNGHSEDYLMKLVDDAVYRWNDKRFDALVSSIELWELKYKDSNAHMRVLRHLRRKMDDAEKNKDEKAYSRLMKLYEIAKR